MVKSRFIDVPTVAPELGVFFLVSLGIFFGFMKRIKGRARFIDIYLASRIWEFLKHPTSLHRYLKMLKFIIISILLWPAVTLLCWTGALLYIEIEYGSEFAIVLGISVFLISCSSVFALWGILNVVWEGYRIGLKSLVFLLIGIIFYIAFQLEVLFLQNEVWFFGLSSIFFAANCIVMILMIYIEKSQGGITINTFVSQLPNEGALPAPENLKSIKEILDFQKKDTYKLSQGEVNEFFTVPKGPEKYSNSPISGGIHILFENQWFVSNKRYVGILVYFIALITLAVYGILAYYFTEYPALGYLNFFLIFTTDLALFFFLKANLSDGSFEPTLMAIVSRFCIFIWTGEYWFIGYSFYIIFQSLILFWNFVDVRFPLAAKAIKEDLTKKEQRDLTKTSEFVYLLIILMYILVIVLESLIQPEKIPYTRLTVDGFDYPLWLIGITVIDLTFMLGGIFTSMRLYFRKLRGIQDRIEYFFYFQDVDLYWVFTSLTIGVIWISGIATYLATWKPTVMMLMFFLPIIIALYLNFYLYWVKNDYSLVLDISAFNLKNKKKIEQETELIKRITLYQEGMLKVMSSQDTAKHSMAQMVGMTLTNKQLQEMKIEEQKGPEIAEERESIEVLRAKSGLAKIDHLMENVPKDLKDWKTEMNVFKAFFKGNLCKSDYAAIISLILMLAFLGLNAGIIYAVDGSLMFGTSISVLVFVFTLIVLPINEYLATSRAFGVFDYVSIIVGLVINYGFGYVYYHTELNSNFATDAEAINICFLSFFFPIVIFYLIGFWKWRDNKWKLSSFSIISFMMSQIFSAAFGIYVLFTVSWQGGAAVLATFGLIAGYLFVFMMYVTNNFYLTRPWQMLSYFLTILACWLGLAVGLSENDREKLNIFAGFTVSFFTVVAIILLLTSVELYQSFRSMKLKPIFFSPWVFPIYKYDTLNDRLVKYNRIGLQVFSIVVLIMIYSVICVIWVFPVSAGIAIGSFCEVLGALIFIYITGISPLQLGTAYKFVNPSSHPKSIKKAWQEAKENYLKKKGVNRVDDFASYAEIKEKIRDLCLIAESMRNGTAFEIPNKNENKAWRSNSTNLNNLREVYAEIHSEEKKAKKQYIQEIELMINFQLCITAGAISSKSNEIMFLNSLFSAKAVELRAFGIQIDLGQRGSIFEKYQRAKEQLERLNPIQRIRFESIKEQYKLELVEERKLIQKRESAEKKAMAKRMETSKKIDQQRQKMKEEQGNRHDVPIDEMIDSPEKFKKIIERYRNTGEKFVDKQFPPDVKSLGERSAQNVTAWKRAGDECKLYEGGISPEDIKQGALGDCYFLSAMTVLGKSRVESIFLEEDPDPKCGAYLMKFYRNGDPVHVIVDDNFPINAQGEWAFVKTISGTELWPMLLEKAYAKLNGSYDSIAAGKVQYALADLTGGAPEEIRLESAQSNSDSLWSKMTSFYQNGYLMGTGSPENPQGDLAVSEMGIVQGHAYAILEVQEIDGEKLIKLRNPHGQFGTEWRGDWCDSSFKWTKKFLEKLKVEEKDDGIFWMSLEDFVWEYKSLYICRIFDDPKWNNLPEIEGAWSGIRAAGLPCRDNPQIEFGDNPQYVLKVSRPCTAFIVLTQKETVDMFKGKQPIMFMVFYGDKRVRDPSKNLLKTSGSPIDLKTVSVEVPLDKGNTFVIMAASMYKGERGFGSYILDVTVDDAKASISELP